MTACTEWSAALLDMRAPVPAGVVAWNGSDVRQRFNVYRNNIFVSLTNALCDTFPVVMALVGEPFFREMAREFVRTHPPRTPVLSRYGESFPGFVAGYEPARTVPYLADVAGLEIACRRALHAADAQPIPRALLAAVLEVPANLPGRRFALHPSVQLLESRFAIASLWAAHQGELDIGTVDPYTAEYACVLRDGLVVKVLRLPAGEFRCISALRAGLTLGDAVNAALNADPAFAPERGLGKLLAHSVICGVYE